jgi:hypothetical protein
VGAMILVVRALLVVELEPNRLPHAALPNRIGSGRRRRVSGDHEVRESESHQSRRQDQLVAHL